MKPRILHPTLLFVVGLALIYGLSWQLQLKRRAEAKKQALVNLQTQVHQVSRSLADLDRRLSTLFSHQEQAPEEAIKFLRFARELNLKPLQFYTVQQWPKSQVRKRLRARKKFQPSFTLHIPKIGLKLSADLWLGVSSAPFQSRWPGQDLSEVFPDGLLSDGTVQVKELSLLLAKPSRWWVFHPQVDLDEWVLARLDTKGLLLSFMNDLPSAVGYQVHLGPQNFSKPTLGVGELWAETVTRKLAGVDVQVELTVVEPPTRLLPTPQDGGILGIAVLCLVGFCFWLYKLLGSLEKEQQEHGRWERRAVGYQAGLEEVRHVRGLEPALRGALEAICTYTGWPLAHVMIPDQSRQNAQVNLWSELEKGQFKHFIEAFESKNFQSGESLMDRVIGYEKIVWIEDISSDVRFSKIKVRYDFGVKTAIGIPITIQGDIVTVLEFYCDQIHEWDQEKIDWSLAIVGRVSDLLEAVWSDHSTDHYKRRFESVFAGSSTPMATLHSSGAFEYVNQSFEKTFGYTQGELRGRSLSCVLGEHEKTCQQLMDLFSSGKSMPSGKNYRGRRKDGGVMDLDWEFSRVPEAEAWLLCLNQEAPNGSAGKMTVASHLSRGYKLKESLSLEAKLRGDYMSALGTEIHSPLETVASLAARLMNPALENNERSSLQQSLVHWTKLISRKVNRALELSKVEADSLVVNHHPFDLRRLIEQTIRWHAPAAYQKGVEVYTYLNTDVKTALIGDHKRLATLLGLLIENAVEFTNRGEVQVEVFLLAQKGNKVELRFVVKDTGKGIGQEQLHQIRQMITSGKRGPKPYLAGSIGLPLADGLAKRFGSGLKVESKLGLGTSFSWNLRCLAQPEAEIIGVGLGRDLAGTHVLVVCSHQGYGQMVQKTLSSLGADVEWVASMSKVAPQTAQSDQYGLILFDQTGLSQDLIQLNGNELNVLFKEVPLLWLADDNQKRGLTWEGAAYGQLQKPISQKEWYQTTMTLIGREDEITPGKVTEPTPTVLVVADNKDEAQLVFKMLDQMGVKTLSAQSAAEATACFGKSTVDLVIVDLAIPGIEADELLGKLREVEAHSVGYSRPILAVTDSNEPYRRHHILSQGANEAMSKPLDLPYLSSLVQQYLLL